MDPDPRKIRLIMALRQANVANPRLLGAIEQTPRDLFVPAMFAPRAYDNTALPIACGQMISAPLTIAVMIDALDLDARMKLLEVGTGSGYQAAVLARLARRVYTVERHRPLLIEAESRWAQLGLTNITARYGDGARGWPEQAPFSRMIVTAAAEAPPPALIDQLGRDGILVLPLAANGEEAEIVRITRTPRGLRFRTLLAAPFLPLLPGAAPEG